MQTIGKRLIMLRIDKSLQQKSIANKLAMPQSTYSKIEQGLLQPKASVIITLAKLYGVTTDYILLGEDATSTNTLRDVVRLGMKLEERVNELEERLEEEEEW